MRTPNPSDFEPDTPLGAWVLRVIIAVMFLWLLSGCTTIDRVNVNTVAVNCDVERADDKAGAGEASASLTEQSGAGAAQFMGNLRSTIKCRHGTTVEVQADGRIVELDPLNPPEAEEPAL